MTKTDEEAAIEAYGDALESLMDDNFGQAALELRIAADLYPVDGMVDKLIQLAFGLLADFCEWVGNEGPDARPELPSSAQKAAERVDDYVQDQTDADDDIPDFEDAYGSD